MKREILWELDFRNTAIEEKISEKMCYHLTTENVGTFLEILIHFFGIFSVNCPFFFFFFLVNL